MTAPWTFSASSWAKSREPSWKHWRTSTWDGAYYAGGNTAAAVDEFAKALDLRVAGAADAALIYSSTVALQRARNVLEMAS